MKNQIAIILFLGIACVLLANSSPAADLCERSAAQGKELIQSLQASVASYKGLSPDMLDNQGRKIDGKWYSNREVLSKMEASLSQAIQANNKGLAECRKGAIVPQLIIDGTLAYYTDFISIFLPGKMGHISAQELIAGYPLGGPDAFVPSLRDHVLKNLGLENDTGDIVMFIKDPANNGAKFIQNTFSNPALKVEMTDGRVLGGTNSVFRKMGIPW